MLSSVGGEIAASEQVLFRCLRMPGSPIRIIASDPVISVSEIFSADLNQLLLIPGTAMDRYRPFGYEIESFKHSFR